METNIKKVGIIISILAVIILALVGCFCVANVNESRNTYVQSNNDIMTTADADFILQGDYTQMQDIWNSAIEESKKYNKNIKVVLGKDWIAQEHTTDITSFGEGVGFTGGRIEVPASAKITLDLNGKTINRDMVGRVETAPNFGNVIGVAVGELTILDSSYNEAIVSNLYETNKTNKEALFSAIENLNCGKIIGGYAPNGGGIYVDTKSILTFSSGIMLNNKANYGGAIYSRGLT